VHTFMQKNSVVNKTVLSNTKNKIKTTMLKTESMTFAVKPTMTCIRFQTDNTSLHSRS